MASFPGKYFEIVPGARTPRIEPVYAEDGIGRAVSRRDVVPSCEPGGAERVCVNSSTNRHFRWLIVGIWLLLPAAASGRSVARTTLTIIPADGGVRLAYALPGPVNSLALGKDAQAPSVANISTVEPGLSLEDGVVRSARPFARVTLFVRADSREVDSVYPLLSPIAGKGFVLFAPYVLPTGGRTHVVIEDGVHRNRSELSGAALDGYVVTGASTENSGLFRSVTSANTPVSLREMVMDRSGKLLAFYQARLKIPLSRKPVVVLAYTDKATESGRWSNRGDVPPNGVVFLRINASAAQIGDPALTGRLTAFLSHELFHLWNGNNTGPSSDWWLHEGGAEYASWIAGATLWPAEFSVETSVGGTLRTCSMFLGSRPMIGLSDLDARSVRYPCGAVMQWVVDAGVRAGKNGDAFSLWRRLLSERRDGSYGLTDFRTEVTKLASNSRGSVDALLDGKGIARWRDLAQAMNHMGAHVEAGSPTDFTLRLAAAQALVRSACGTVQGVGEDKRGLYAQGPKSCVMFGDGPVIERLDGFAPMVSASDFYEAAVKHCGSGVAVPLTLNAAGAARSQDLTCTVPVDPPAPALTIFRALPPPRQ